MQKRGKTAVAENRRVAPKTRTVGAQQKQRFYKKLYRVSKYFVSLLYKNKILPAGMILITSSAYAICEKHNVKNVVTSTRLCMYKNIFYVGATRLTAANLFAFHGISTTNSISEENSRSHTGEDDDKHGQNFQETCHDATSFSVYHGFGGQSSLDDNLPNWTVFIKHSDCFKSKITNAGEPRNFFGNSYTYFMYVLNYLIRTPIPNRRNSHAEDNTSPR